MAHLATTAAKSYPAPDVPNCGDVLHRPQTKFVLFVCGWEAGFRKNCQDKNVPAYLKFMLECTKGAIASVWIKNNKFAFVSYHKKADMDRVLESKDSLGGLIVEEKKGVLSIEKKKFRR